MTKYLIFDSGPIINITQNCMVSSFRELSRIFQGEFIITNAVRYEIIEHPKKIKRFEWGAIRIQNLLEEEILKISEDERLVDKVNLDKKTQEVLDAANNTFHSEGKPIHLIERGEAEAMALSLLLGEKNIESAVVIDERTARMLCENPEMLRELMENKLGIKIKADLSRIKEFQKINVIRSAELVYMAYKKKIIEPNPSELEAMLYALKFGGCSISEKEVQMYKKV